MEIISKIVNSLGFECRLNKFADLDKVIYQKISTEGFEQIKHRFHMSFMLVINGQEVDCMWRDCNYWEIRINNQYLGEGSLPLTEKFVIQTIDNQRKSRKAEREHKLQNDLTKVLQG